MPGPSPKTAKHRLGSSVGFIAAPRFAQDVTRSNTPYKKKSMERRNDNNHDPVANSQSGINYVVPKTYQEQSDFKAHFFGWLSDKNYEFVTRKGNNKLREFLKNHHQYKFVEYRNAYTWVTSKRKGSVKSLTMDELDEIGRGILFMRTREGGFKRVTDDTIVEMINEAYKSKQIKKIKETGKEKEIKMLNRKTITKYKALIKEKFDITYFSKSMVKKKDRIDMENDIRSDLSNISLIANITNIPRYNPLHTKLKYNKLPLALLFNIDSTTFQVDVDLHRRDKGTYDKKDTRNHVVSSDNDRLPFNLRITALCNGIGQKRIIIAIKCDKKFINNQKIRKVENPYDKDVIIYLTSGDYSFQYFTEQVIISYCICSSNIFIFSIYPMYIYDFKRSRISYCLL